MLEANSPPVFEVFRHGTLKPCLDMDVFESTEFVSLKARIKEAEDVCHCIEFEVPQLIRNELDRHKQEARKESLKSLRLMNQIYLEQKQNQVTNVLILANQQKLLAAGGMSLESTTEQQQQCSSLTSQPCHCNEPVPCTGPTARLHDLVTIPQVQPGNKKRSGISEEQISRVENRDSIHPNCPRPQLSMSDAGFESFGDCCQQHKSQWKKHEDSFGCDWQKDLPCPSDTGEAKSNQRGEWWSMRKPMFEFTAHCLKKHPSKTEADAIQKGTEIFDAAGPKIVDVSHAFKRELEAMGISLKRGRPKGSSKGRQPK